MNGLLISTCTLLLVACCMLGLYVCHLRAKIRTQDKVIKSVRQEWSGAENKYRGSCSVRDLCRNKIDSAMELLKEAKQL